VESGHPILGEERDPREVEHVQNVGEAEFILEEKPTTSNSRRGSKTPESTGQSLVSQDLFHIDPWGEGPLTCHALYPFTM